MKIKFKKSTIDRLEKETTEKVGKIIQSPALLSSLGDLVIKDIKRVTQSGKSTLTGSGFAPLTPKWIKDRARIAESMPVDPLFKPNRSNLTLTGQLLNSFAKRIIPKGIQIYFSGFHEPYRKKYVEFFTRKQNGKKVTVQTGRQGFYEVGERLENQKLADYVGERRPFMFVRDGLLGQLKSLVIRYIRRNLK